MIAPLTNSGLPLSPNCHDNLEVAERASDIAYLCSLSAGLGRIATLDYPRERMIGSRFGLSAPQSSETNQGKAINISDAEEFNQRDSREVNRSGAEHMLTCIGTKKIEKSSKKKKGKQHRLLSSSSSRSSSSSSSSSEDKNNDSEFEEEDDSLN